MTLSTLDIKTQRIAYLGATIFCFIFSTVYEFFSHDVYSNFMTKSFLIPLVGLILLEILLFISKRQTISSTDEEISTVNERPQEMLQAFMAGAVIWLTLGSIFKGVLEIYGTTNHLTIWFLIIGGIQLLLALGCWVYGYVNKLKKAP